MIDIQICIKSPITWEWMYGIMWKQAKFDISVHFVVDTNFILIFMLFLIAYH